MTMTETQLAERLNRLDCILQDVERFGIQALNGEWDFAHSTLEDAREVLGNGEV